jgi:hypothetical protein
MLATLDDILITKISHDTDIAEWQLRQNPDFWQVYNEVMNSETETLENICYWVEERAYEGVFTWSWEVK